MKKFLSAVLGISLMIGSLVTSCSRQELSVSRSGFYFDTIITITLYGTGDESLIDGCFALAKKYENLFSATVEDSDVSRINENAGSFVTVDPETAALIQKGIDYGTLSGGRFDITLGKLTRLWNIPEIAENLESDDNEADASLLPSDAEIKEALAHVDYRKIQIDGSRVMLTDPESELDLGGIAKGYIADRMKEYLNERQVSSGIINLGGNVLTIGEKKDGSYRIGIQKPFGENGETIAVLEIADASVVSSGVYERFYRIGETLYHHILDPDTGYPYQNGLYEVTIISRDSADGDALSTACFALGPDDGMELVESLDGVEAVFVTSDQKLHMSSGIRADKNTLTPAPFF